MKNLKNIKKLVGESVTEEDLRYVDCYVQQHLGLFIPSIGQCQYATQLGHVHPAYMFIICFENKEIFAEYLLSKQSIFLEENTYLCVALSPNIPHEECKLEYKHYYCIMIEKEYFESQYRLYSDKEPFFNMEPFLICHDVLKILNGFAFEYSKRMPNTEIVLEAQTAIITHWLIRSILGESYNMRALSSDYRISKVEHYIEQHFAETITITQLAELGNMSVSNFIRTFKKEMNITPKEYLIQIRIEKAKKMLRRNEWSVTEVSMRCGFNSSAHFSTSFTKLVGMTPTEYKNGYKG